LKRNNFNCGEKLNAINLATIPFKRGCRYHRKQGTCYNADNLIPNGFCPYAYAKIYPLALSLLYNGKERKEKIFCPNKSNQVEFLLSSTFILPPFLLKAKQFILFLFNKIGVATEFPDKKISIKVIGSEEKCRKKLVKGKDYSFNLWSQKELCPASFYAMYPLYRAGSIFSFHCPDPEGIGYQTGNEHFNCKQVTSSYKMKHYLCPLLLYSLYPYYLTLKDGGNFEWLLPGENVKVQCPHCQGITSEVSWNAKKQAICVKIRGADKSCYWKIVKDKRFNLSAKDFCEMNLIL
jgi:uncharacterized repeat protein (TIGR04076 family)